MRIILNGVPAYVSVASHCSVRLELRAEQVPVAPLPLSPPSFGKLKPIRRAGHELHTIMLATALNKWGHPLLHTTDHVNE